MVEMELDLQNKVVVVTGGSSGIGRAIVEGFVGEGANVSVIARNADRLHALKSSLNSRIDTLVADVTSAQQCGQSVRSVLERWGKIDILVCNVGRGQSVPPGSENREEWQRLMDLNLYSTTNMVEASIDALKKTAGNIICLSSICGMSTLGAPLTYSAAKAALNSYIHGAARAFAPEVRINGIAPGNILFEGGRWEQLLKENPEKINGMIQDKVPMGRFGTAKEIADLCLFLSSPRASFCTGSIFVADGGQIA